MNLLKDQMDFILMAFIDFIYLPYQMQTKNSVHKRNSGNLSKKILQFEKIFNVNVNV